VLIIFQHSANRIVYQLCGGKLTSGKDYQK